MPIKRFGIKQIQICVLLLTDSNKETSRKLLENQDLLKLLSTLFSPYALEPKALISSQKAFFIPAVLQVLEGWDKHAPS